MRILKLRSIKMPRIGRRCTEATLDKFGRLKTGQMREPFIWSRVMKGNNSTGPLQGLWPNLHWGHFGQSWRIQKYKKNIKIQKYKNTKIHLSDKLKCAQRAITMPRIGSGCTEATLDKPGRFEPWQSEESRDNGGGGEAPTNGATLAVQPPIQPPREWAFAICIRTLAFPLQMAPTCMGATIAFAICTGATFIPLAITASNGAPCASIKVLPYMYLHICVCPQICLQMRLQKYLQWCSRCHKLSVSVNCSWQFWSWSCSICFFASQDATWLFRFEHKIHAGFKF